MVEEGSHNEGESNRDREDKGEFDHGTRYCQQDKERQAREDEGNDAGHGGGVCVAGEVNAGSVAIFYVPEGGLAQGAGDGGDGSNVDVEENCSPKVTAAGLLLLALGGGDAIIAITHLDSLPIPRVRDGALDHHGLTHVGFTRGSGTSR